MTKENKLKLQKEIYHIILNSTEADIFYHTAHCVHISMPDNTYSLGFTANDIAPYIAKKLGYRVNKSIIKYALAPIKYQNYFIKPIDK